MSVSSPKVLKVLFTEFTSTDGLLHEKGTERVGKRLKISKGEQQVLKENKINLVAQIWGDDPEKFAKTARLLTETGHFDGIDINMGCPVKKVVKKNTCSALIAFPSLAKELILATKENTPLPVSVKTRIGIKEVETENWIGHLLETNPAAITVHGRTQKMQSEGLANWEEIGKAASLRNQMQKDALILGNGDVNSYAQGIEYMNKYGLDGIMVGRGIFKSPWMFNEQIPELDVNNRIQLLLKHMNLYTSFWKDTKNFHVLRRFFKIYIAGFRGASQLRADLMNTHSAVDVYEVLTRANLFDEVIESVSERI